MIEFKRISPALVANPEAGGDVLFLDAAGVYYTKDENGNLKVLGNGIGGIAKVGTVGLVDTYEITLDSGETYQYTVTNAKSIVELVKIGTSVLDSTYRITFNDGPAFEYVVKDGRGIQNIEAPANAGQPNSTDTYTVRYNDGSTSTFIVRNGRDGLDGLVLSVNGISQPNIVLTAADVGAIPAAEKGAANGVATLGADSKIPAAQLPSFVDDVLEFSNLAAFPATGETGKIYVAIDTGFTYRWSGSQYIEISAAPVTQVNGKVGNVTLTTSDIGEGTNLYFTAQRVRDTVLTGLSLVTNAAITAADSVLSAFGKLQKQLTDHFAAVDPHPQYTTNAEATTIANDAITAHVGQADPHTQYLTQTEADALFTTPSEAAAAAPVQSVFGRTGAVTAQQSDYDAFFTTPAEAAAAAPVQSFNGRTGAITPQQADYDAFFTTPSEAAAAAPVQSVAAGTGISVNATTGNVTVTNAGVTSVSVNGGAAQTGAVNVTIPNPKLSATITTLFASTANSTAVQIVLSLAIPSGYLTQGKSFDFDLEGTQSQSAAATNVVGAIFVNNTQLVSAAVAGGTAAQTNRSIRMKGGIMWNGANYLGNITTAISGVLPVGNANVTGVAVAAATAHNIDIRVQTSTANAANIIRAMVAAIKEI